MRRGRVSLPTQAGRGAGRADGSLNLGICEVRGCSGHLTLAARRERQLLDSGWGGVAIARSAETVLAPEPNVNDRICNQCFTKGSKFAPFFAFHDFLSVFLYPFRAVI